MKGYVYYKKEDSIRNQFFLGELLKESYKLDIDLKLLVDGEQPSQNAEFILFRDRNPALAEKWELEGFRLFNRAEVNRIANDKLKSIELATLLGVPVVPTKKLRTLNDIRIYPAVLKTIDGHGGNEVFLTKSPAKTETLMKRFANRQLIVQPYIESGAQDIRVFVVGNEIVGAVKRTGRSSFKSNYTLGGSIEQYTLSSWQKNDALTIARALKSDYIGIDFLLLPDGRWLLNEIEDPVGARSLYETHNFSVAQKLVDHIKCQVKLVFV